MSSEQENQQNKVAKIPSFTKFLPNPPLWSFYEKMLLIGETKFTLTLLKQRVISQIIMCCSVPWLNDTTKVPDSHRGAICYKYGVLLDW